MEEGTVVKQPQPAMSIKIREMDRTDAEFAGDLQINAFESKFAHAAGKEK